MTNPTYWRAAKTALSKQDKTLKSIIDSYRGETMTLRGDAFFTLARSIAGQQISVKAADSVWRRFAQLAADSGQRTVSPKSVLLLQDADMRSCGLSGQKVAYMRSLADYFIANARSIENWPQMSDDAVIGELTSVHGIGRWTAEMFLIFNLARPDVFPVADIGLQKAIFRHYHEGEKIPMSEIRAHGERWKPWRTVATWYLWRSLDPVPVSY